LLPQSGVNQTYYYDQVLLFTHTHTHTHTHIESRPTTTNTTTTTTTHTHVLHTPHLHPGATWQKRAAKTLKKNMV
jgi:hypothetical protein